MSNRPIILSAALAGLALSSASAQAADALNNPALVEAIAGSSVRRLTLTERAAQRLNIGTAAVARDAGGAIVVPYASIIYDKAGSPWVYTTSQERVFIRHQVRIARISRESAVLAAGPDVGTRVVIVGVSELYGTELGIGK